MSAPLIFRILAVITMLMAAPAPVSAQTSPRGAAHADFGRMVFDWDGPVQWSADVVNGQMVVRFEKPVAGDPRVLLKPLSKYLKGVTLSADRRMATFSLAMPVQIKSFLSGSSTVIDLTEAKGGEQPAPQVAALPPKGGAVPAKVVAPVKAEPASDVTVRGGEHAGFNRLVFDWAKPVGFTVEQGDGKLVLNFDRPANINVTSLEAALPGDVRFVEARPQGKGTALVLSTPAGMKAKHTTNGPKVVVDLVRGPAPQQEAKAPEAKAAPPPPPAPEPKAPEPKLPPAPEPKRAEAAPPVQPLAKAAPPVLPPEPVAAPISAPVKSSLNASLGVSFDQPTGAAVFRRAGWLWLVFDRKSDIDAKLLKRTGGDVVLQVEQIPGVKGGSAVRLITKAGYNPTVRKEGQLWVFDLAERSLQSKNPLEIERQFDFEDRGRLLFKGADSAVQPVVFRDPEVGDMIQVMPVATIGAGVPTQVFVPGADILPTVQGVAMVPLADGARLEGTRTGIELGMPGGLHLSRDAIPLASEAEPEVSTNGLLPGAQVSPGGPMDLTRWMRGGLDRFVPEHQKLMARLIQLKPDDRTAQRMEVARHYLANGMGAEALGILRGAASYDPALVETAPFRAVRGLANFMMLRDREAIEDLAHPSLVREPSAQVWLAAAKARSEGDPVRYALALRPAAEEIKGLSPRMRMMLGRVAAQAVAQAGDSKGAGKIIEAMNGPGLNNRDLGAISYLQGVAAESARSWDQAVSKYREAEDSESRPDRAAAGRARVELQLRRKQITADDAIHQLERLRFAWRGADEEYQILKRISELLIADGRYGDGLRAMRTLATSYSEHPDIGNVQQMMSSAFEKLFLEGAADPLSAITAIGLYDEFQELTPSGSKGDEMIRKLADRLASVDLLDRASDLLRHQVQFRLNGEEKARVGARLALLELSDHKSSQALESLDLSEAPNLPAELYDQRRYMRVRALADVGRAAEALAMIVNDPSDQAKQLRAEINWALKRWPDAAVALESMIEPPFGNSPMPPPSARRLLDLATAMTLGRDERGLSRLRRTYGQAMAGTEFRQAFELLTSEPERGIVDYRRVADKIKQVEQFQSFMNDWRKRIETKGLSSIN